MELLHLLYSLPVELQQIILRYAGIIYAENLQQLHFVYETKILPIADIMDRWRYSMSMLNAHLQDIARDDRDDILFMYQELYDEELSPSSEILMIFIKHRSIECLKSMKLDEYIEEDFDQIYQVCNDHYPEFWDIIVTDTLGWNNKHLVSYLTTACISNINALKHLFTLYNINDLHVDDINQHYGHFEAYQLLFQLHPAKARIIDDAIYCAPRYIIEFFVKQGHCFDDYQITIAKACNPDIVDLLISQ